MSKELWLRNIFKKRYSGVDNETYRRVLSSLRPSGIFPIQGELPKPGELVYPVVEELLANSGWLGSDLKVRWISIDRVACALATGSDRDKQSVIDFFGDRGEYDMMKRNGLDPITDVDLVTYVGPLNTLIRGWGNSGNPDRMSEFKHQGLLVY